MVKTIGSLIDVSLFVFNIHDIVYFNESANLYFFTNYLLRILNCSYTMDFFNNILIAKFIIIKGVLNNFNNYNLFGLVNSFICLFILMAKNWEIVKNVVNYLPNFNYN